LHYAANVQSSLRASEVINLGPKDIDWEEGILRVWNGKCNKLNDRYIRELVDRYAEKTDIGKHVNPHLLRHTFPTELLQEGYNIREVQKLLAHSHVSARMIYTHVYDSDLANKIRSRKPIDI
jgi:site-specific recombinase XerD